MSPFKATTLLTEEQKYEFAKLLEESLDLRETENGPTWKCSHDRLEGDLR